MAAGQFESGGKDEGGKAVSPVLPGVVRSPIGLWTVQLWPGWRSFISGHLLSGSRAGPNNALHKAQVT